MIWDALAAAFDANCAALQAIKDAGGDVNVSAYDPDPARKVLGSWLITQRQAKKNDRLSAERITRLDALGVIWDRQPAAFDANCAALQEIKDAGGDVNVSTHDPDPARKALKTWSVSQRQAKKKGTLSAERISRLEALGLIWDPRDTFDAHCAALQAIKDAGGDVNVSTHDPDHARKVLGVWLSTQRQAKKNDRLSAERITRLEALGVSWGQNDAAFDTHCAALQEIKDAGGDVNVSKGDRDPARKVLGGFSPINAERRGRARCPLSGLADSRHWVSGGASHGLPEREPQRRFTADCPPDLLVFPAQHIPRQTPPKPFTTTDAGVFRSLRVDALATRWRVLTTACLDDCVCGY